MQLLQQGLGDGFLISQVSCRSAFGRALEDGTADVVLSDTEALGFAHLSLLEHVRAARRPVPVVLFSADERVATAVEAMRRGAADYLLKPHQQILLARSLAGAVASSPWRAYAPEVKLTPSEISRELRSPLLAIDGFAQALARETQGIANDNATRYVKRLLYNVRYMGNLVDRLGAAGR
ncbi:MAG: two component, sigma54 specific, transcriptional regulator, Fis family [Ramlibacter sp.]|nr:two component, sigma54 specific, transcriptional regulator, Fis family [Ramlibacter sp.]